MQTIETKYFGPNTVRGAIIKASCFGGYIIVPFDHNDRGYVYVPFNNPSVKARRRSR